LTVEMLTPAASAKSAIVGRFVISGPDLFHFAMM